MHTTADRLAVRATTDERAREQLIQKQQRVILSIASRVSHKYVTTSDDEWSVALCAFSHAVDTYDLQKGSFSAYAETVIRRSLIDSFRSNSRFAGEFSVSPETFSGDAVTEDASGVRLAVVQNSVRASDTSLRDEITALSDECRAFGFGFTDLANASPKQQKTRSGCAAAVGWLLQKPERLGRLFAEKRLPIAALAEEAGVSRKVLERYRRYIITAAIVLSGDYPMLSEYFTFIGKEASL